MARSEFTTDRDDVERWAESHDAVPVREAGRVELVPENETTPDQERIDWDAFHHYVDDNDQVVMYHGETSDRQPFEISNRTDALDRAEFEEAHDRDQIENRLLEGETIEGTVTETTVVTETVVEETTLESEIVDQDVVDRHVTDVELLDRDCRSCSVESDTGVVDRDDWVDTDRFVLADDEVATGQREEYDQSPYDVTVEVDERWRVTIDERERYTVETRITDVDVAESETVDSKDIETQVDVDAVHDQLLRTIDLDHDEDTEVVDTETYDIDSEFTENDRITTSLTSHRTVQKEVAEQWELATDVVAGELRSRETLDETVMHSGLAERDGAMGAVGETEQTTTAGEPAGAGASAAGATDTDHIGSDDVDVRLEPQDDDVGKPVVVATGDQIGMVTEVEGDTVYVDPHPGMTEKIMAKLGWGDRDDDDLPLASDRIAAITDDDVRLTGDYDEETLEEIR
ncbi:hypothetical protein [Halobacterium jilantaiense]|uniref:PRC-barrel domain-containing protein n=1 Tax=Halobacterium jilantaiense TaxID=355548 RepID=A0A1I0QDM1_9EURY|nr:hypothetical protein [Halobacterium jilantaiense]SEW25150.1 hypothetical protein SAMN04487945_2510 [Halobacterium jilantaiense]